MLTATCAIWRKVKATTNAGGADDTWVLQYANVPCRLMPELSRRVVEELAGREAMLTTYRLTVPYDTDLRADDRVVFDGDTYEVLALWDDHDLRTARRAWVGKVA
jgi:SPP1 family predicted phage head-tail adaptor